MLFYSLLISSGNFAFFENLGAKKLSEIRGVAIEENEEIKMIAVGDVMLSRKVEETMKAKKDFKYPFLETAKITSGADIVFGNLETSIIHGRKIGYGEMVFRTDPKSIEGLKFAGFNILSIANNHIMNFGKSGLENTIKNLDDNNILHAGAGMSLENIYKPAIKEIKGIKFAFLAYTYNSDKRKLSKEDFYGVANMNIEKMKSEVQKAKLEADVVIVSMHAGTEYRTTANKSQKDFAYAAIDAGADLVVGHHPHVVETVEKYKGKYILYSLGNFVFDQMWSDETRLGAIAEIIFKGKEVDNIKFTPVKIFDYSQPRVIEGKEADKILERLKS